MGRYSELVYYGYVRVSRSWAHTRGPWFLRFQVDASGPSAPRMAGVGLGVDTGLPKCPDDGLHPKIEGILFWVLWRSRLMSGLEPVALWCSGFPRGDMAAGWRADVNGARTCRLLGFLSTLERPDFQRLHVAVYTTMIALGIIQATLHCMLSATKQGPYDSN